MSDNDSLVDRANALITRRRSFVAAPPAAPAVAETALDFDLADSAPPTVEDDLPVLTEVVDLSDPAAAEASKLPAPAERDGELQASLVAILAADLAQAIEQRLATELPGLVEKALTGLQHDLQQTIETVTEAATQDFIARRQQQGAAPDPADNAHSG